MTAPKDAPTTHQRSRAMSYPSINPDDYDRLTDKLRASEQRNAQLEQRVKELEAELVNAQQGVALYMADPHKVKTYAHAAVFIELLGERLTAALASPPAETREDVP